MKKHEQDARIINKTSYDVKLRKSTNTPLKWNLKLKNKGDVSFECIVLCAPLTNNGGTSRSAPNPSSARSRGGPMAPLLRGGRSEVADLHDCATNA